jgi:hypothetical protein
VTAQDTTAQPAERKPKGGAYLPKLPDGWRYRISIDGPAKQRIFLSPGDATSPAYVVEVDSSDVSAPRLVADDLDEAARRAVKAARALDKLHNHRTQAQAQAEAFMASLGAPSPRGNDGKLTTPEVTTGPGGVSVAHAGDQAKAEAATGGDA